MLNPSESCREKEWKRATELSGVNLNLFAQSFSIPRFVGSFGLASTCNLKPENVGAYSNKCGAFACGRPAIVGTKDCGSESSVLRTPPKKASSGIGLIRRVNVIASPKCSAFEFHSMQPQSFRRRPIDLPNIVRGLVLGSEFATGYISACLARPAAGA